MIVTTTQYESWYVWVILMYLFVEIYTNIEKKIFEAYFVFMPLA